MILHGHDQVHNIATDAELRALVRLLMKLRAAQNLNPVLRFDMDALARKLDRRLTDNVTRYEVK